MFNRECTRSYNIPDTDVTIEKGTAVVIPVLALHRDAKFYPEPEKFIPERFHPSNNESDRPYMPFGDGPRACM